MVELSPERSRGTPKLWQASRSSGRGMTPRAKISAGERRLSISSMRLLRSSGSSWRR